MTIIVSVYDKEIILGVLIYTFKMIDEDEHYKTVFSSIGQHAFMENDNNG